MPNALTRRMALMIPANWTIRAAKDTDGPDQFSFTGSVDIAAAASEGKRPSFSIDAYNGGPMRVAAFFTPVILDLKGLKASRGKLPILMNHDIGRVVGQADDIQITDKGVKLSGTITGDDGDSGSVVTHAKNGFEWQASIGASVDQREFLEAGKKTTVNGREVTGPLLIARKSTLIETSFVSVGADRTSSAKVAANSKGETDMGFEKWLKANGIENLNDFDALPEGVQKQLKAAYKLDEEAGAKPAEKVEANAKPDVKANADQGNGGQDVQAIVAQAVEAAVGRIEKTNQQRSAVIEATAGHADLQAKALKENWSVEKAELEVIKASRPNIAPYVNTGAQPDGVSAPDVLTAAMCMAGNLPDVEKQFNEKVLEAAHGQYRGRIGLQQMLLTAAWAGGYSGHHFDNSAIGMRDILKAAFSTYSISGILSNTANKFLLAGFNAVETGWRSISAIRNVSDFKEITSYRLTGNMEFEEVGPAGEIKHGTLDEQSFTNQARTYAKMLGITRQDIINDDLGALTVVPMRIGRGGALQLNKVFWTEFMDNSSFFTDANNNFQDGSGTVLSIDSLTTAEQLFFDQTDPDGDPLGLTAATLLVPNALNVTATQLMSNTEVRDTTASKKYLTGNPHAGKFDVVRSSYLSNAGITGNSTLKWYLLANPNELPVIETVFLNGVEAPTVETADADFNTLGIQVRGYFDFGVSKQDPRGGVASKGEA